MAGQTASVWWRTCRPRAELQPQGNLVCNGLDRSPTAGRTHLRAPRSGAKAVKSRKDPVREDFDGRPEEQALSWYYLHRMGTVVEEPAS
jgi:hypothetical protein